MIGRFSSARRPILALALVAAMNSTPSQAGPVEDAQEILRLTVTAPNVAKYLVGIPAGAPLRVANATAVDFGQPRFTLEGRAVAMVPKASADRSTLEIVGAELGQNQASLRLRYRRQGIRIDGAFAKVGQGWTVQTIKLVEH